jgi:translation initiation factor IF-3
VVKLQQALEIAEKSNHDLVMIAPQAQPPVCRVMDYGKFKFEQTKKEKEAKKKQKIIDIKEIRMTPNTDTHDFNTKVGHALKFLKDGDKVKVTIRFRGREVVHSSSAEIMLKKFAELCSEVSVMEKSAKLEGRNMTMFLAAK